MSASRRCIIDLCTLAAAVTTALATMSPAQAGPATNGRIAFQRADFDRTSVAIFTIDPDGTDLRQVTHPAEGRITAVPDWSPDGRKMAYQRGPWGSIRWHIVVARVDGTHRRDLTKGSCQSDVCAGEGAPAWSPDGTRIAFQRFDEREVASVFVMRADGTHRHRVTHATGSFEEGYSSWSPDGSRLVFERYSGELDLSALFIVRIDGTHLRRITRWGIDAGHPEWSPVGGWILFDSHTHGGAPQQMCLIHPDGRGLHAITHGSEFSWSRGSFSPDATMITALREPGVFSENDVYVMNVDGTGPSAVTGGLSTAEAEGVPDWGSRG